MGEMVEFPGVARRRTRRPLWRHVLGEVLRGERLEQERILTEVAAMAGVSPQYLSEVERGRKEASSEVIGAVADALGLELADVVGRVAGRLGAGVPEPAAPAIHRRADASWRTATAPPAPAPRRPSSGSVADVVLLAA
jgi:transcriptional regulator with XRE-family HTH domain